MNAGLYSTEDARHYHVQQEHWGPRLLGMRYLVRLLCFRATGSEFSTYRFMDNETQQYSKHISVPSNEGVRVDKSITIERPVTEVYSFWRRLENLPRFMKHLESVAEKDNLHSHWRVKAAHQKSLEWDAEIIEQRTNEMISWRSAPGADIDNAGSVWFTSLPDRPATMVRLEFKYLLAPAKAGELSGSVLGADADLEIEQDLRRLKELLEAGQEIDSPRARRAISAARAYAQAADNWVHDNAWIGVASAGLCGIAIGLLVGQSFSSSRRH